MFPITSSNEGQITVTASPKTASGQPAAFDGALRVTVLPGGGDSTFRQDPATPNAVTFVSSDTPGVTSFLVEGDADLGTPETLIQEVVEYTVTGANAAAFGLTAGAEEPKAAPAAGARR